MAARVSSLTGALTLNVSNWSAGLKQAQKDASAFSKALGPVKTFASDTGKAFTAAGVAIGGSLLAMAKKAADFGDNLLDASKKTGIATEKLAGYKLLAEQSGTSFEALTGGMAKLSKSILDTAEGTGEAQKAFKALGINVKDSTGRLRNVSDVFPEIVDRLSKMEDGTEKVALAQRLMGRSAADLIPLINEGREGIERAEEATRKYNTALTKAEAVLGDQFNDALEESKTAMQGLANAVGVALLPKLTELVNKGNDWIAAASKWVKAHPQLTVAIGKTAVALTGAGGLLLGLTGVVTIAPKVYEALLLVGRGIRYLNSIKLESAAISWITNLTSAGGAVSNVGKLTGALGNLRAGVALVGEAFKTGGFIAGIQAIRSLTALPAWMRPAAWVGVAVAVYQLADAYRDFVGAKEAALQAVDREFNAAQRLANLTGAKGGSRVTPRPGETPAEFSARAQAAEYDRLAKQYGVTRKAGEDLNTFYKRLSGTMQEVNGITRRSADATNKYRDSADAAGSSVQQLQESFMSALRPADELDKSLTLLQKAHFSNSDILKVYSSQIIEAAQAQREHGFAVSDNIKLLERQALIASVAGRKLETIQAPIPDTLQEFRESMAGAAMRRAKEDVDRIRETERAVRQLKAEGLTNAQIMARMGREIESAADDAQRLGERLDPLTADIRKQTQAAEDLRRSWGEAFASISDQLVDMIVDFDFSFRRLGDIGKSTAKQLGRSFLDGFFKPFRDQLEHLGETAAKKLGELLFGGGQAGPQGGGGSAGGLFSGVGGLLGGLFGGKKGGGAPTIEEQLGGLVGIGANASAQFPGLIGGRSGAGQLTGLMGTLDPISMGLGIANSAVQLWNSTFGKIGAGRKKANEIVKSQNAFQGTIEGILGDTELSALNKSKLISNTWEDLQRNFATFGATDPNSQKVVNQAFAELSPWIADIQRGLVKEGAGMVSGAAMAPSVTMKVEIHNTFETEVTELEVRETIMPAITDALESAVRGYRERWSQLLVTGAGTTPAPVGI